MLVVPSRWTMPILRVSMGFFLVLWGIDKLVTTGGSQAIFSHFYGINAGELLVRTAGVFEIAIGVALAVGLFRLGVAWLALIINAVSTFASWRQILDPWGVLGLGPGGTHLFLASIVIMAVNIVLVLNAGDDTATLDARFRDGRGEDDHATAGPAEAR